nr:MAG TPA: hypothetical protein [Caudoviricetes sp.]
MITGWMVQGVWPAAGRSARIKINACASLTR